MSKLLVKKVRSLVKDSLKYMVPENLYVVLFADQSFNYFDDGRKFEVISTRPPGDGGFLFSKNREIQEIRSKEDSVFLAHKQIQGFFMRDDSNYVVGFYEDLPAKEREQRADFLFMYADLNEGEEIDIRQNSLFGWIQCLMHNSFSFIGLFLRNEKAPNSGDFNGFERLRKQWEVYEEKALDVFLPHAERDSPGLSAQNADMYRLYYNRKIYLNQTTLNILLEAVEESRPQLAQYALIERSRAIQMELLQQEKENQLEILRARERAAKVEADERERIIRLMRED